MLGTYEIRIENAYIRYEFSIKRNITVIRGESATGKTTLFEMIRTFNEQEESGVEVRCSKNLVALYGKDWAEKLQRIKDSIVFIDEQSRFVKSRQFAELVRGANNYFVIITREKLSELPFSITEVYGIRNSGKYAGLAGEYTANEFYHIYGRTPGRSFDPDVIITENSNAGYEFWDRICGHRECISAGGKSKIISMLKSESVAGKKYLAVVDGAAFGAEMEEMIQFIRYNDPDVEVYAPESFEYILLTCGLFRSREIEQKCSSTSDYADSVKYMSWEQFYTQLLTEVTQNTPMAYSKKHLNLYYLSEKNMHIIMEQIPEMLLL